MKLAIFDFDGTITTKDSLVEFIQFSRGKFNYYMGLVVLSPMLLKYKLRLIPNYIAKEKLLSYYFKGWDQDDFIHCANNYCDSQIDTIIREKAIEEINWHKNKGHKIVIVSASIKTWIEPWSKKHNLELLATELEFKDKKITGSFSTSNCYGIEKVNRLKEQYNLSSYEKIYAYGDSRGDKELLALANESFYKPFREKNKTWAGVND